MTLTRQLGRYELLEQLAEGGMGTVWLARLTGAAGFEKLCIVKTVLPSIANDAEFVSRFLHEGRVLTQLSHGNIAQVLDMNEAEGQLFLALEYVAGVDLARLHRQVRASQEFMPLPLVVALITQAAEGLGAAHRKHAVDGTPLNIVHRDVSPHNIMVSYEGEVKVIDFGIAKSEARSRHTAQASVMGKLGYMAPEQARGEQVDHRADQFALGIVAWELLSNESWVRRGTVTEMVVAMANPTVRALAPLRSDVPASLEAVVLKALSPLPSNRFTDTDAFAQALMGELLAGGAPPTKPQLGEYVRLRCSNEFATTRLLLTRVSTQRNPPSGSEGIKPELDETLLRTPGAEPALTARSRPMVSQLTAPLAPPVSTEPELAVVTAPETTSSLPPPVAPVARVSARPGVAALSAQAEPDATVPRAAALEALGETSRPGVRTDVGAVASRVEAPLTAGELSAASTTRSPVMLLVGGLVSFALLSTVAFLVTRPAKAPSVEAVVPGPPEVVSAPAPDAAVAITVGVPDPVEPDPAEPGDPEFAPPKPPLQLAGRRAGAIWILASREQIVLTACRMTLPGQRVARIGTLRQGSVEVPNNRFRVDASAPALTAMARIDCDQGAGVIALPR